MDDKEFIEVLKQIPREVWEDIHNERIARCKRELSETRNPFVRRSLRKHIKEMEALKYDNS